MYFLELLLKLLSDGSSKELSWLIKSVSAD